MPVIRKAAIQPEHVKDRLPTAEDAFLICPLIGKVRTVLLSALDREFEPFGITGIQFGILKHVADGSARTAADLCRLLHYDNSSMTRMIDRLEERAWLKRERSKDDRRVVSLKLTAAGRAAASRLRENATRVAQRMLGGFTAGEVEDLRRYLLRVIENDQPAAQGPQP